MSAATGDDRPLYESGMGPFAWSGLKYEAVHMIGAVLAAAALAGANYAVAVKFELFDRHPLAPVYSMAALAGAGFLLAYWEMSFYPRRIAVYPGRIRFKMLVSWRDVMTDDIVGARALEPDEARRTYYDWRVANLSPGITGMVRLDRRNQRSWVFCPEDPDGFLEAVTRARSPAMPGGSEGPAKGEVDGPA